ncbi:hypothetical protein ACFL6D_05170 [Spirochaetota bacterium]
MERWHFDGWDGKGEIIYNSYILPMHEGVIIAGGNGSDTRWWGQPIVFGMVACDIPVGRGSIILSQALATERYMKDSVATKYLHNILKYALIK